MRPFLSRARKQAVLLILQAALTSHPHRPEHHDRVADGTRAIRKTATEMFLHVRFPAAAVS
jgi:hypothetical protein